MKEKVRNFIYDRDVVIYYNDGDIPYDYSYSFGYIIVNSETPHITAQKYINDYELLDILMRYEKVAVCNPFNNTLFANYNKNEVFIDGNYLKISKDRSVYCSVIIRMSYHQNVPTYVVVHSCVNSVSEGEILSDERVLELLKSKYHDVLVKSDCKMIRNFDHIERS